MYQLDYYRPMEYSVTVGCNWSTNDMGIANHGSYDKNVPVENIVPGYNLFEQLSTDRNAEVVSFEDGVLAFKFLGETITVKPGHIWSSPMYHVYNPYISESEGFYVGVSKVGAEKEKDEKKNSKRIMALVKEMREIAKEENYPVWKNIPLARELAELLQGSFPVSGKYLSASDIMFCCDVIFLEDLLSTRDVPRLCLEFLQIRKLANKAQTAEEEHYPSDCVLGVVEADRIQNKLDLYVSPNVTMEWWVDYVSAHLLFDPVERTPKWEEIIYDVEEECDRRLKGVPRGMGFCFMYWSEKRAILAEKYGIEWRSPHTMNPRVMFD